MSTQPLFRLVWSDDQYELRTGTFGKFVDNIKIAEYQATEQVLKYSWIKERWIVEQWFPPEVCLLDELPESKQGSFEPIYVFETSKGVALPLKLEVVQFLVQASLKPKTSVTLGNNLQMHRSYVLEYHLRKTLDNLQQLCYKLAFLF